MCYILSIIALLKAGAAATTGSKAAASLSSKTSASPSASKVAHLDRSFKKCGK
jgi:hypothetical protein